MFLAISIFAEQRTVIKKAAMLEAEGSYDSP
jgi:hypothetical protein